MFSPIIHYYALSHPSKSLNWFCLPPISCLPIPSPPLYPLESADSPKTQPLLGSLLRLLFWRGLFGHRLLCSPLKEKLVFISPVLPPRHSCFLSPISVSLKTSCSLELLIPGYITLSPCWFHCLPNPCSFTTMCWIFSLLVHKFP